MEFIFLNPCFNLPALGMRREGTASAPLGDDKTLETL